MLSGWASLCMVSFCCCEFRRAEMVTQPSLLLWNLGLKHLRNIYIGLMTSLGMGSSQNKTCPHNRIPNLSPFHVFMHVPRVARACRGIPKVTEDRLVGPLSVPSPLNTPIGLNYQQWNLFWRSKRACKASTVPCYSGREGKPDLHMNLHCMKWAFDMPELFSHLLRNAELQENMCVYFLTCTKKPHNLCSAQGVSSIFPGVKTKTFVILFFGNSFLWKKFVNVSRYNWVLSNSFSKLKFTRSCSRRVARSTLERSFLRDSRGHNESGLLYTHLISEKGNRKKNR